MMPQIPETTSAVRVAMVAEPKSAVHRPRTVQKVQEPPGIYHSAHPVFLSTTLVLLPTPF